MPPSSLVIFVVEINLSTSTLKELDIGCGTKKESSIGERGSRSKS